MMKIKLPNSKTGEYEAINFSASTFIDKTGIHAETHEDGSSDIMLPIIKKDL